ncbi:hypothetical protein ACFOX2_08715 [Corynebacterium marambiense]|uniref:hypothetical protein n=1 Tax=Corynebacterium marambiense TaxID=2765364 RepID=UPI00361F8F6A
MSAEELERLDAEHQDAVDLELALTRKLADGGSAKQLRMSSQSPASTGITSTMTAAKTATRTTVRPA